MQISGRGECVSLSPMPMAAGLDQDLKDYQVRVPLFDMPSAVGTDQSVHCMINPNTGEWPAENPIKAGRHPTQTCQRHKKQKCCKFVMNICCNNGSLFLSMV